MRFPFSASFRAATISGAALVPLWLPVSLSRAALGALPLLALCFAAPGAHAQTFTTPGSFNYVVANGVTSVTVVVNGAGGLLSNQSSNINGGNGGSVTATLSNLVAGTTLTLFVGGNYSSSANGSGGLSSGGEFSAIAFGANQTRASLIAAGAANTPLLVLAGGGGGSAASNSGAGGAGGGTTGGSGGGNLSGTGGSQTAGGTAGQGGAVSGTNGSFLLGGDGGAGAGGGGGGFYGGGGGSVGGSTAGAGGGGSSFSSVAPSAFNGSIVVTNVINMQGGGSAGQTRGGSGQVGSITVTPNSVAAPEPGSIALLLPLMGVVGLGAVRRRRKNEAD